MTNQLRNEFKAKLNEREYLLRATFSALVEIEDAVGVSIPKLMEGISENNLPLRHAKAIFVAGIKGAGGEVNEAQLEEDLAYAGISSVGQNVVGFLMVSTFGGERIKKN